MFPGDIETIGTGGPYAPLSFFFPFCNNAMRIPVRSHVLALAIACSAGVMAPSVVIAQTPSPTQGNVLTLTDALTLARRNNPTLANSVNARRTAAANVRAANGAFLPNVNSSFGGGYREGRQTFFQGQGIGSTNDQLSTDASANASLNLSLGALNDRRAVKAEQEATESDIAAAEVTVRNNVITQYLAALQAQASATLQDTLLATTTAQLQLARARLQVGSGTQLDVQRAEVADGQQRVASLRAHNTAQVEVVRLFQQIGVEPIPGTTLDSNIPAPPTIELQSVLDMAKRANPALGAFKMREESARRQVSSAKSGYYPSLSLSAGVSAFTNRFTNTNLLIDQSRSSIASSRSSCIRVEEVRARLQLANNLAACEAIAFTPAQEQAIRDGQGKYPFDFTRQPYSVSASLSLPLFNGFRREQQIEQAQVQQRNAQNNTRSQELRVTADVTAAYLQLNTAQQTVVLQEQNVRTARTALSLAQERYRVGAISIVDLVQARGDFERAETDRITAVYDVQRAFAALENAVGRPLR